MEQKEELLFANNVETVAQDLLGPNYDAIKLYNRAYNVDSWIKEYLPVLYESVTKALQQPWQSDRAYALSNSVMYRMREHVQEGVMDATDGVSWAVAAAVIRNEESVALLNDLQKRALLDDAISVPVEDYLHRHESVSLRAAYETRKSSKESLVHHAKVWKKNAEYYKSFQTKLREPASITPQSLLK